MPSLDTFEYNAKMPSTFQWNIGVQKSLPCQMVLDVSYVGNHAYNRLGCSREERPQPMNQVPLGTAYLPQYQDPTLGAPSFRAHRPTRRICSGRTRVSARSRRIRRNSMTRITRSR